MGLDFHSTWKDIFCANFIAKWLKALEETIPEYKVNEKPGVGARPVSNDGFCQHIMSFGITYEIGNKTPKYRIEEIGTPLSVIKMMKLLLGK